jgi:hypothetical protein
MLLLQVIAHYDHSIFEISIVQIPAEKLLLYCKQVSMDLICPYSKFGQSEIDRLFRTSVFTRIYPIGVEAHHNYLKEAWVETINHVKTASDKFVFKARVKPSQRDRRTTSDMGCLD